MFAEMDVRAGAGGGVVNKNSGTVDQSPDQTQGESDDESQVRKNFPETWIWMDADGFTR